MALTFQQLEEKRRQGQIIQPNADLFSDWEGQPAERQPSQQSLSPDPFLFSDWEDPTQVPGAARPDDIAESSGVTQFARQEREPRVLGYSQRAIADLERGLAGLRLPLSTQDLTAIAGVQAMSNIPMATLNRMAREAREEGLRRGLIPPEVPGADASVGERLRHYFPDIPTTEELTQSFLPGQPPQGWEPVLRDVLKAKFWPDEDIEHIVELTRSGQVPMLSTSKDIPDWESPLSIRDTLSGMKVFGQSLLYLPPQLASAVVKSLQGVNGTGIHNKGRFDKLIREANEDLEGFAKRTTEAYENKKFLPGIPIRELAQLPRNIAFSLTSVGHGLAAGTPIALIPVPGARVAAVGTGMAASGIAAYKMASYEVMQNYLELANADMIRDKGREITPDEEKQLKGEFLWKARKYGLWEAIPEMLGNVAQIGTVFAPLNRMLGKSMATRILAKMGGVYSEELFTEALTQIGQSNIEAEAGFPGAEALDITSPKDWLTALQQVAPQTFLLTVTLGGAGATYAEVRSQLTAELGEGHDQFKRLLKNLRKRHIDPVVEPDVEITPDVELETGEPAMVKLAEVPKALPIKTVTLQQIETTTAASDFDEVSVQYLMSTGMTHEEILATSEVMRDMAFQEGISGEGLIPGPVQTRDTGEMEDPLVAAQRDRMAPVEGDTVIMPYMQQSGTLLRYNNDGTGQVSLPSGLKMKVEKINMIKANDLNVPLRAAEQARRPSPAKKVDIPKEFSPIALADDMLRSMPDEQLLAAISMVGEGTNTPLEAIFALSFGHPQQDLIRSLAGEIGEEVFVDMMVDAVSEAAAEIEQIVEQKRKPVPRQADPASQEYADTTQAEPTDPPPYTVSLNEYIATKSSPLLQQVTNIRKSLPFQAADPKAIERYVAAVDKLVAEYLPEEYGAFHDVVQKYNDGDAKLSDIDIAYSSFIHRRLATVQFAELMRETGLSDPLDAAMVTHRRSVADAIANKLPVSEKVLKDYPDLTGQPTTEAEPELPGLEELRRDNIAAQERRVRERGGDKPTVGLQVQVVGPGGLPLPGKDLSDFDQAAAEIEKNNPEVAGALNAGRNLMDSLRGWKERWAFARRAIAETLNPKLDKELRKIMPQYVDDKRTGYLTIASKAQVRAQADLGSLWGDLNKNELDALMNIIFTRSLMETGREGMDLPRDITAEQAEQSYNEQVELLQERAPEILEIMDRYQLYMQSLAQDMVDRGWMKAGEVRDFYAPHIILDYTPAYFLERPYLSKQGKKAYQAYLKKREGSTRDIIANQEAIFSRVATIHADMMFDDWVIGQLETYDIYPKMTPEAKLELFNKRANGRIGEPQPHGKYEIAGRTYRGHQYIPGNMIYRATVIDSSLLAEAFKDAMEDILLEESPTDERVIEDIANRGFDAIEKYLIGIGPRGGNALRSVRALGARNKTYLIPEELYNDMKHLTATAEYNIITEVMYDARRVTALWKTMVTMISGGIPFHLRNEQGDILNVVKTAGWKPLTHVPNAIKILANVNTPENLSEFEKRVLDIVLSKAVLEAGHLTELRARSFQLKGNETSDMKKAWNYYLRLSGYRELSNRVALVSYNLRRSDQGKPIDARDMKSQISGLDTESKIAYVARNAPGDYGDVPAWYRRRVSGFWFPFATFYQKNLNNWANLVTAGHGYRLKFVPAALSNVIVPFVMLWLWNNYGPFKKVEEGLGYRKRKGFHANLWQWDYDEAGIPHKGLVFSPEHPADLALESIGADRLMENIDYVRRGILTPKEAATKQIYDFGVGGLRMGQRLLNPLVGAFIDITANKSAFSGTIVPREEEGLPDYDKLRYYWWPHMYTRILSPLGQYMTEERSDKPPLYLKLLELPTPPGHDPYEVNIRIPRRPVDFLRGLGFYTIDLDKELDRDWWQMRQNVGANRARQMRKFRTAYVSSPLEIDQFLTSDKVAQLMDETWRKDFAIEYGLAELKAGRMPPRGSLLGYLMSPTVQLEKAKSKLRDPKLSSEGRHGVEVQIRKLKELRRLQDLDRIRKEELPATLKQILRRINKKLERDSGAQQ